MARAIACVLVVVVGVLLSQGHIYIAQTLFNLSVAQAVFRLLVLLPLPSMFGLQVHTTMSSHNYFPIASAPGVASGPASSFTQPSFLQHMRVCFSLCYSLRPHSLSLVQHCVPIFFFFPRFSFHQNSWQTASLVLFSSSWSHDRVLRTKAEGKVGAYLASIWSQGSIRSKGYLWP